MLAIVPVNKSSARFLPGLQNLFEKLGPNREHTLLIASAPEYLEEAQTFATTLQNFFQNVRVASILVTGINPGTPEYRTTFFRQACQNLVENGNTSPFIWLENACPTNADWLDIVEDEWNRMPHDRFFLGCVEKAFCRARDKKTKELLLDPPMFKPLGDFMRFGVYPANLLDRCPSLQSVGTGESFEMLMRHEIVPLCQLSVTMATVWASVDWERPHGSNQVYGKQDPRFETEIRKNARLSVDDGRFSIIHGCRDASLAFLLSRKKFQKTKVRTGPSVAAKPSQSGEVVHLRAENAELRDRLARLEAFVGVAPPAPDSDEVRADVREHVHGTITVPIDPQGDEHGNPVADSFIEQTDEVVSTLGGDDEEWEGIEEEFPDQDSLTETPEDPGDYVDDLEEDFSDEATIEEVAAIDPTPEAPEETPAAPVAETVTPDMTPEAPQPTPAPAPPRARRPFAVAKK